MLENCPDFMGISLCIFYHCSDIFCLNCVKPITCKKHVRTMSTPIKLSILFEIGLFSQRQATGNAV